MKEMLELLQDIGPATSVQIQRHASLSQSVVSRRLKALKEIGRVRISGYESSGGSAMNQRMAPVYAAETGSDAPYPAVINKETTCTRIQRLLDSLVPLGPFTGLAFKDRV